MNIEARLIGGPRHGDKWMLPEIKHELVVGTYDWSGELLDAGKIIHHHYRPVGAVVYYEHEGVR